MLLKKLFGPAESKLEGCRIKIGEVCQIKIERFAESKLGGLPNQNFRAYSKIFFLTI